MAALETMLARLRRHPAHTRLLAIVADGADWSIAQLAEAAHYQRHYIVKHMRLMQADGLVLRVRRGVYRRAQ